MSHAQASAGRPSAGRDLTRTGLALAIAILLGWGAVLVWGLGFHPLGTAWGWLTAPLVVALQTWLNVGLFIIAHDCMHGSLAPGRPGVNRTFGRLSLLLYAGFSFDKLLPAHHAHHRHSGSAQDPDFDADHPKQFWRWYLTFIRRYMGLRELALLAAMTWGLYFLAGIAMERVLLFWALPAMLSSAQLFLFGTWLPHRHADDVFADRHNTRSSGYGWVASLFSCFHFGHHHEHHLHPGVPWWRLPTVAAARAQGRAGQAPAAPASSTR